MDHSADTKALEQICGDMDDMESKKMFKEPEEDNKSGVSIVIDVVPKGAEKKEDPKPEAMAEDMPDADDEMKMPPFLRKKK